MLILLIFLSINSIYAFDNNTVDLEINNENTLTSELNTHTNQINESSTQNNCPNELLTQSNENEILSQNNNNEEDILSKFEISTYSSEKPSFTLSINDTKDFETTGNITIKMHISFTAIYHDGEFPSQNISIYENNTLIRTLNIGEQNLPELGII